MDVRVLGGGLDQLPRHHAVRLAGVTFGIRIFYCLLVYDSSVILWFFYRSSPIKQPARRPSPWPTPSPTGDVGRGCKFRKRVSLSNYDTPVFFKEVLSLHIDTSQIRAIQIV